MRFVRWGIAVFCGIVFLIVGIVSTLLLRINDTALNDDFYVAQLQQADLYNFFYDDLLPPILEDLTADLKADGGADLTSVTPQFSAALRKTLPPEWLQAQSEATIHQVIPYAVGKSNSFSVQVPLRSQTKAAVEAIKDLAASDAVLDLLFEQVLSERLKEALPTAGEAGQQGQSAQPIEEMAIDLSQLQSRLRAVLDNAWIRANVNQSMDALVPYLTGESDSFELHLSLADRKDSLRKEINALLAGWDTTAFLSENGLDPLVAASIPADGYPLSFGMKVTREDVKKALGGEDTAAWREQQAKTLVDSVLDYLLGESAAFALTLPLDEIRMPVALSVGQSLDARLANTYATAPVCTAPPDLGRMERDGITCHPLGVTYTQFKESLGIINLPGQIAASVSGLIPGSLTLSEENAKTAMDPQWQQLQAVRQWFLQGFSFTDEALKENFARQDYAIEATVPFEQLAPEAKAQVVAASGRVQSLETFRGYIRNGFTFTDADLRQRMEEAPNAGGPSPLDGVRPALGRATRFAFLFWLMPLMLLIPVALWGGRTIATKVLWAASFLGVLGLILIVAAGPVYKDVARERIMGGIQESFARNDTTDRAAWEDLLEAKGVDVAGNVMDEFALGISTKGYMFLFVALAAIGAAGWYLRSQRHPQSTS